MKYDFGDKEIDVRFSDAKTFLWTFRSACGMLLSLERQVTTMTTLENLYYGNIAPHDYEVPRDSEYYVTAQQVVRHENELSTTLTDQQKEILQKIKDNQTELLCLGERDAFCRGFSLAVKLINRSHERKHLTCPVSPCVARKERSQSYPIKQNKPHTADLSRLVGEKKHKLRVRMDSKLVLFLCEA